MITQAEREFVLELLDETQDRILRLFEGLSTDQLVYRPQPDCWSVAENVEHLVVTERRLMSAIEKLLEGPPDFETQCSLSDQEVLRQVGTVVDRVPAPKHSLPTLRWPAERLSQEFQSARQRTRDFTAATTADLRRFFLRHFLFGDLDDYQWLLLIGAHAQRHGAQAERVKTAPGFPIHHVVPR
jgi:DinB superfamily